MKKIVKENQKNNALTITLISGISLLLLIFVFSFSSKGTAAGLVGWECPDGYQWHSNGTSCFKEVELSITGYSGGTCTCAEIVSSPDVTGTCTCENSNGVPYTADCIDSNGCGCSKTVSHNCTSKTSSTTYSNTCSCSSNGYPACGSAQYGGSVNNTSDNCKSNPTYGCPTGEQVGNKCIVYADAIEVGESSSSSSSSSSSGKDVTCYGCLLSGTYIWSDYIPGSFCVSGWYVANDSRCSSSDEPEYSCYCWGGEESSCGWYIDPPDVYEKASDSKCSSDSTDTKSCWVDKNGKYFWGNFGGYSSFSAVSQYKDEASCLANNSSSSSQACYYYNGLYHWVDKDGAIASGGRLMSEYTTPESCKANNPSDGECFCFDTGSGAETCKRASVSSGGEYTLVDDPTCISDSSSDPPEDKTVYVSYNANGGKIVDNRGGGTDTCGGAATCNKADSCTIASGSSSCKVTINLSAERDGYTFKGWAYVADGTTGITGSIPNLSKNTTMYAVWEECDCDGDDCDDDPTPPSSTPIVVPDPEKPSSSSSSKPSSSSKQSSSSYEPYYPSSSSIPFPSLPSSGNVDENPKTGQIFMFVVWVVALGAIVYSVWYFRKMREVNEE